MKPIFVVVVQLTFVFLTAPAFAQGTSWQPANVPAINFKRAGAAKIYQGKNGAIVLGLITFKYVPEEYVVEVPYVEELTRLVTDPKTGETREEQYQNTKTVKATKQRTKIERVRSEVSLADAKIWTVSGKSVASDEAQKVLASPKRCFLLIPPYTPRGYTYAGDPFYNEMLKEDVLVIWYDKEKAKEIPAEKN